MSYKKICKLMSIAMLSAALLGGCGEKSGQENSGAYTDNETVTESNGETKDNTEKEGSEEMSVTIEENQGELLQNTEDLTSDKTNDLVIDMEKVDDIICPSTYSLKRPDVQYGTVEHFTYYSTTTECERPANILLPADYDPSKKYPVLYFLHGIFGDENSMLGDSNSKIKEITANLKEDGVIGDVIIVFPHMYATGNKDLAPGFSAEQTAPYDNFINDLTNDLIPYVEEHYGAMSDRENRAIIGFSMGGRETLYIGTVRSDLFTHICAISPAPGVTPAKDWAMEHPGQMKEEEFVVRQEEEYPLELLMICCGTKDSVVGQFPASYDAILTNNGVKHLWYEIPDADHDSNAIKSGFFNFLIRWQPGK